MDIWTKVFIINLIVIIATVLINHALLDKRFSKNIFYKSWGSITDISIPVWLIYVVVTA